MATNQTQRGDVMAYTNSGSAITSGSAVVMASRIGVALTDIAATTGVGSVAVEGVFELAALSTQTWAHGDLLYWDAGNSRLTTVATANTLAGYAFEDKANGAALGRVKLQG